MNGLKPLYRLWHDTRAATAVEFAIVSFVFFMLMFGIIEYGLIMMTKVAIESATIQVSRSASIGSVATGCSDRACAVSKLVQQKTLGLVNPESVIVTATVVSQPTTGTPPIPDLCFEDPETPYPPTCNFYYPNDGVDGYQQAASLAGTSIGAAGNLVEIRVSYGWRVLFPLFKKSIFGVSQNEKLFGPGDILIISSSTVIKNEPF